MLRASVGKTQMAPSSSTGKGWLTAMEEHQVALCSRARLPPLAAACLLAEAEAEFAVLGDGLWI